MGDDENDLIAWARGLLPPHGTDAFLAFMAERLRLVEMRSVFYTMRVFTTRHMKLFLESLVAESKTNPTLAYFVKTYGSRGIGQLYFGEPQELLLREVLHCRDVDNFLVYLTELLVEVYSARPEALRSSDVERLDFILGFESMEALVRGLADKRVETVSRRGATALAEEFERRLGVTLFPSSESTAKAALIISLRNASVHSRGRMKEVFKDRASPTGEGRVRIESEEANEYSQFLMETAAAFDQRVSAKFGLKTIPLKERA